MFATFALSASKRSELTDAAEFGFSPTASGMENTRALQQAVAGGGKVVVSGPGTYRIGGTIYLGSHTSLLFGEGVTLQKVEENGPFAHVFLNQGALSKTWDEEIAIEGLNLRVNGVDVPQFEVYGLRGQIAFFYVKKLRIARFCCLDVGKMQYAIHVCTFEDVLVEDVVIEGDKDGIHFGRGKRFTVRNGVFRTFDDAIALNGHDYATGNPELGWIEDGVIENCRDLAAEKTTGYFCRILAGAWLDWQAGMEVQQSDTVVHQGRLYRVQAQPDGTLYRSFTPPPHQNGSRELDGINWGWVQNDVTHTAGVRNVVFSDIFLEKPRVGFSIHFDNDRYSRSYYPGSALPIQQQIRLENVRVLHDSAVPLLSINTPLDVLTVAHSRFGNGGISFHGEANGATQINLFDCTFAAPGEWELLQNTAHQKQIRLQTVGSIVLNDQFCARVSPGSGTLHLHSDLPGLSNQTS